MTETLIATLETPFKTMNKTCIEKDSESISVWRPNNLSVINVPNTIIHESLFPKTISKWFRALSSMVPNAIWPNDTEWYPTHVRCVLKQSQNTYRVRGFACVRFDSTKFVTKNEPKVFEINSRDFEQTFEIRLCLRKVRVLYFEQDVLPNERIRYQDFDQGISIRDFERAIYEWLISIRTDFVCVLKNCRSCISKSIVLPNDRIAIVTPTEEYPKRKVSIQKEKSQRIRNHSEALNDSILDSELWACHPRHTVLDSEHSGSRLTDTHSRLQTHHSRLWTSLSRFL
jgi:hypothetical protein